MNKILFYLSVFLYQVTSCTPKPTTMPKLGNPLTVISSVEAYTLIIKADTNQKMVRLNYYIPSILLDLRYVTTQNFMQRAMYPEGTNETYLRLKPAKALQKVQESLQKQGIALKIFDAYRPYSVTQKFWELVHDERFVANPAKGSGHNRGTTVDLTLVNLNTGRELNMGTGFDNFSDSARADFKQFSEEILNNRKLLRETMEKNGFKVLETEWWHYGWIDTTHYDILNLSFKQLHHLTR
jgi:D-alanyl-D-alanine dipeptidase